MRRLHEFFLNMCVQRTNSDIETTLYFRKFQCSCINRQRLHQRNVYSACVCTCKMDRISHFVWDVRPENSFVYCVTLFHFIAKVVWGPFRKNRNGPRLRPSFQERVINKFSSLPKPFFLSRYRNMTAQRPPSQETTAYTTAFSGIAHLGLEQRVFQRGQAPNLLIINHNVLP
jgi:hypothetical protein